MESQLALWEMTEDTVAFLLLPQDQVSIVPW